MLTLPAANMKSGADIACTFVNALSGPGGLTGRVFTDNGAPVAGVNSGRPNDGLRNGAETGLAGILLTLSDCASTVYASATTDDGGAYRLVVPAAAAPGSGVCVSAAVPGAHLVTGASAGGIDMPDGVPTAAAGVIYTYTRASQRLAFTLPGSGELALDFAAVPFSTFAPGTPSSARAPTP